jgi:hypothetical protein
MSRVPPIVNERVVDATQGAASSAHPIYPCLFCIPSLPVVYVFFTAAI